jgi:pimeloyl-ACP methyl ester carboxylesterase
MSTFVLVHGAWGGAHNWRKVRPLLRQAGHEVFSPSLTGQGERVHLARPEVNLSTHVQDVVNAIWHEDLTDIVLVGHSYGGMVVTGVAEQMPERIQHLVFLDAFQPADGQSLYDIARGPGNSTPAGDGDWRVAPMVRVENPDNPDVQWATARRHPQSRATFEEPVRLSMPLEQRPFSLTYIVASERPDPETFFDKTAERLRANPRWTVRQVPGPHNMAITHPRELADVLLELFGSKLPVSA